MDSENLEVTNQVICGELVIGNHDSLLLYSANIQSEIRDISKIMSQIIVSSNSSVYDVIRDVIDGIESFEQSKRKTVFGQNNHTMLKKYNSLQKYIDDVGLALQLEQAQQIKLGKLLEIVYDRTEKSIIDVSKAIKYGEDFYSNASMQKSNDEDIKNWLVRLDKKIIDLQTTRAILLQNKLQIALLKKNNIELIDKIVMVISNTIPIWRNQTSLLLGIEVMDRNVKTQQKVYQLTENYIKKGSKKIKKHVAKKEPVDVGQFMVLSDKLSAALVELSELENENESIRNKMQQELV